MAKYINGMRFMYAENVSSTIFSNIVDVRYLRFIRIHYRIMPNINGTLRVQASCYPINKTGYNWVNLANISVTTNDLGIHLISDAAFTVLRLMWDHSSGTSSLIEAHLGARG